MYQLKITLRDVKPPVWRRILVESDVTLWELTGVLWGTMGWAGYHLHAYDVGGKVYGIPDPDWELDFLDEKQFRLDQVLPKVGMKMRWDYDFGDGWEHDVLLEAITLPGRGVEYPVCLAGRRACPPDDCGGPSGYADLLEILADPDHPDHEDLREWAPDYDPAFFDIDETTEGMRTPRPIEDWA